MISGEAIQQKGLVDASWERVKNPGTLPKKCWQMDSFILPFRFYDRHDPSQFIAVLRINKHKIWTSKETLTIRWLATQAVETPHMAGGSLLGISSRPG